MQPLKEVKQFFSAIDLYALSKLQLYFITFDGRVC